MSDRKYTEKAIEVSGERRSSWQKRMEAKFADGAIAYYCRVRPLNLL
ncbi:MAG: hypothetical protein SXA11_23685 [Cyanobacteriota bacterium]|nr:hypothetical protein [Cyanobacteriota bacterium]